MKKIILMATIVFSSIPTISQARPQRVELTDVVRAVGFDYRDCEYRVQNQAFRKERTLLQSCQNQSGSQCYTAARRFIGGGFIYPITGNYRVDDYKIDSTTCRVRAASRAEQEALSKCQNEYDVRCQIVRRGVSDHRVERRRRYIIAGPKENFQVCRGDAQAAPESRYREQCSMSITVRN